MTINRRGFLSGILVGCSAPVIVRASSLMKIVVPNQEIRVAYVETWVMGTLYSSTITFDPLAPTKQYHLISLNKVGPHIMPHPFDDFHMSEGDAAGALNIMKQIGAQRQGQSLYFNDKFAHLLELPLSEDML